ncbi:MAG: hypothetical protein LLG06_12315 [Desulfobacteraceae bacterium]|nr:hypothetical protein [Desulfobacteraceae bacterium]
MASVSIDRSPEPGRIRVFIPRAHRLSAEEIAAIPVEDRRAAESGDEGVWLDVDCPRDKCLTGDNKLTMEIRGMKHGKEGGIWHELFCPEDRCYARSPLDLP